jgi:hypothetical protein
MRKSFASENDIAFPPYSVINAPRRIAGTGFSSFEFVAAVPVESGNTPNPASVSDSTLEAFTSRLGNVRTQQLFAPLLFPVTEMLTVLPGTLITVLLFFVPRVGILTLAGMAIAVKSNDAKQQSKESIALLRPFVERQRRKQIESFPAPQIESFPAHEKHFFRLLAE